MVAIAMYLVLNSSLSSSVVPKILELAVPTQLQLMESYQAVNCSTETLLEFKAVVEKIQNI